MFANFGTYNYTTNTVRQANGSGNYMVEVVVGLPGHLVDVSLFAFFTQTTVGVEGAVAFGLDSTTTPSTDSQGGSGEAAVANVVVPLVARFCAPVGIGYHALNWLESSTASGTTTWQSIYGPSSLTNRSGIRGSLLG